MMETSKETDASDQASILAAIQDLQRKLIELRQPSVPSSSSSMLASSESSSSSSSSSSFSSPFTSSKRLLVVANRLPMSITKNKDDPNYTFKMSSGGLVSALVSIRDKLPFIWLGWPGKEVPENEQTILTQQLNEQHHCVPVYLSDQLVHDYYDGFANDVLWPLFHYEFQPGSTNQKFNYQLWKQYEAANEIFADTIISIAKEGDAIWVHDYHLMLLPSLLRRKVPSSTIIAWFLHTPWPSSEIFRTLPPHISILRGLMGADLLGFQTVDFSRHFLSSCVRSLRGVESTPSSLTYRNRTTQLGVFPIGIEPENFAHILQTEECQKKLNELRAYYSNVRIIVSVDRLDPIKGVPHRLLALEELFRRHKEWIGKITLIQVAVPSRIDVATYQQLTATVNTLIGRINSTYGNVSYTPIHYMYRSIQSSELTALYACADIGLITSLRDGMNLVSFEYVATHGGLQDMYRSSSGSTTKGAEDTMSEEGRAHTGTPTSSSSSTATLVPPPPGILILSEFAGASQSLAGSLRCNPWNIYELAETIHTALVMNDNERRLRFDKLIRYVRLHTSASWASSYVQSMLTVGKQRIANDANFSSSTSQHTIRPLPIDTMLNDYKVSNPRIIILAYEEVLSSAKEFFRRWNIVTNETIPKFGLSTNNTDDEGRNGIPSVLTLDKPSPTTEVSTLSSYQRPFASPSALVLETLKNLTTDTRNIVVLVSSASMNVLDEAFASVPGLRIIAESGSLIRTPMYSSSETVSLTSSSTATGEKGSLPKLSTTNLTSSSVVSSPTYKRPGTPLHNIRLRNFRYPKPNRSGTTDTRPTLTTKVPDTLTGETSSPTIPPENTSLTPPSFPSISGKQWSATVPYIIGAPLRSFQTLSKSGTSNTNDQRESMAMTGETLPSSAESLSSIHWKDILRPILHDYTISTPGSVIDETPNSLIWRYENSDAELALWNSKELQLHLSSQVTTIIPLDIIIPPNSKSIEIHVREASVLTALIHILDDYTTNLRRYQASPSSSCPVPLFQFALCITDSFDVSGIASAVLAVPSAIASDSVAPTTSLSASLPNLTNNLYMTRVASSSVPLVAHSRTGSTVGGIGSTTDTSIPRWTRGGSIEGYHTVMKKIDYEITNKDQVRKVLQQLLSTAQTTA